MNRRRFTEREVLECLIRQGAVIPCKRCRTVLLLSDIPMVEREHHHELALDGEDTVENCFYSHGPCHAAITNGPLVQRQNARPWGWEMPVQFRQGRQKNAVHSLPCLYHSRQL